MVVLARRHVDCAYVLRLLRAAGNRDEETRQATRKGRKIFVPAAGCARLVEHGCSLAAIVGCPHGGGRYLATTGDDAGVKAVVQYHTDGAGCRAQPFDIQRRSVKTPRRPRSTMRYSRFAGTSSGQGAPPGPADRPAKGRPRQTRQRKASQPLCAKGEAASHVGENRDAERSQFEAQLAARRAERRKAAAAGMGMMIEECCIRRCREPHPGEIGFDAEHGPVELPAVADSTPSAAARAIPTVSIDDRRRRRRRGEGE